MSPENKKKFRNKIKNVDWTNLILNDSCQNAYRLLCFIIYYLKSIIQVFLSNASHSNLTIRQENHG